MTATSSWTKWTVKNGCLTSRTGNVAHMDGSRSLSKWMRVSQLSCTRRTTQIAAYHLQKNWWCLTVIKGNDQSKFPDFVHKYTDVYSLKIAWIIFTHVSYCLPSFDFVGGSMGGVRDAHPSPSNFLLFRGVFGKNNPNTKFASPALGSRKSTTGYESNLSLKA